MSKRRILILNYEYPPLGGGGGHAAKNIATEVAKSNDVFVVTSRFEKLPKFEIQDGVHVYRIPTIRKNQEKCSVFEMIAFILSSIFFLPWYALKIKPDILWCFFAIPCGPAALVTKAFLRIPYIIALRGGDVPGFLPEQLKLFHKLTYPLSCLIWRFANAITANSDGLAKLAEEFYPKKNYPVIHNGVGEEFFHQRQINGNQKISVITVGRLSEQKKIERLLESFGRLKNNENIQLIIVGDGPKRLELESLARSHDILNKTVFFQGWCDREQIKELYKQASVFALASDFEGMPNVVLEAMASSLAIVATDAPGSRDLVKDKENGYLVMRHDLKKFDDAFLKLSENAHLLSRMQQNSFSKVQPFTWKKVAQDFYQLSESCLND